MTATTKPARYTSCAVENCERRMMTCSRYCAVHQGRAKRHGSATAVRLYGREVATERRKARKLINLYLGTEAMGAALASAERLLRYRRETEFSVHVRVEQQMFRLLSSGTTPLEVVEKVCAVVFLDQRWGRFESEKVRRYALARHVLNLRPLRGYRPTGPVLTFLGDMVVEELALFALALWKRHEEFEQRVEVARKAMLNGWERPDGKEVTLFDYVKRFYSNSAENAKKATKARRGW